MEYLVAINNDKVLLNREPGNEHSHTWSNDFQQGPQDHSIGKGQSFQQMVLGKLDFHMQKNETGPLPYTIKKNNSK